jgi:very-short-patch-repair endonuclease
MSSAIEAIKQIEQTCADDYNALSDKAKEALRRHCVLHEMKMIDYVSKINSPIEQLLAVELQLYQSLYSDWFKRYDEYANIDEIATQRVVVVNGIKYRVDFMARCYANDKLHFFAIECDGHEFHEKTKEQVRKDKQRERALLTQGITVIRFSGSEIWNDAAGCAKEAYEIMEQVIFNS